MTELLIRLKNNTNADPVKDKMCYKRGDVVVVMPDGHPWGSSEGLPDFAVIQTDATMSQINKITDIHEVEEIETHEVDAVEWAKRKATGDHEKFISKPKEGKHGKRYDKRHKRNVPTITLTGKVLRPHTRRRWRLSEVVVAKAELTGFAAIPFAKLRGEMQDKITGVTA